MKRPFAQFCRRAAALVLAFSFAAAELPAQPAWVQKRPISAGQYLGIGTAQKNRPASEYMDLAKSAALNDIASQITVTISSDLLRRVMESNSQLQDEFQSQLRASAKADLEGVQLMDTYEDHDSYWVYLRLSKADYEARRAEKMRNAVAIASDLVLSARKSDREGSIARAMSLYAQALGPIAGYLGEPLEATLEGTKVLLVNEIYKSIQGLVARLELRTSEPKRDAKFSRPLKRPFGVDAIATGATPVPVAGLPLRFRFLRGRGELTELATTDRSGRAECEVQKITASDRIQMIEASVDLSVLVRSDSASTVVQAVLKSFSPPTVRLLLNVSGVDVFMEATESMFGRPLAQRRIEPELKTRLSEAGFSFVDDMGKATLAITVKADARQGSSNYGLSFAYITVTVVVLDLETGQEVFNGAMKDVKEGSDSYEKAALKGLDSAAKKLAGDLVPRLVEKVQK